MRSIQVHPKDRNPKDRCCGVVYKINCWDCEKIYIGQTGRHLGTRLKEHCSDRAPLSAVREHQQETGHSCTMEDVTILDKEDQWFRRRIKEAIHIHRHHSELKRDVGYELPRVSSAHCVT